MGVYIKGMEMPKSCPCELLGVGYDLICSFAGGIPCRVKEYYECCQTGTIPTWCPLVPVPEHGRLIDADALYEVVKKRTRNWAGGWNDIECVLTGNDIKDAPTIVPADPAEEGET